jgi:hypothetical protein
MALLGPCVNNVPSVDADVRVDLALIPTQTNSMSADDEAGAVDGGDAADQTPQSSYRVVGVVSHEAVSCDTAGEITCRDTFLQDADVVGTASIDGTELTISVDWRTFGPESGPAKFETELTVCC